MAVLLLPCLARRGWARDPQAQEQVGLGLQFGWGIRPVRSAVCTVSGWSVGSAGLLSSAVSPSKPVSHLHPQSCLEFSLRIQEFIELIRQNKRLDAVRYAARWAYGS